MKWCDFYDNYYDWADSTRKTRISTLEDMGPGDEIVEVVRDIEDPKVRTQLLNKAMKLGAVFSQEDFADLDGELPPELYEKLGKYAGFDPNDPYFDEDNMTWDDFYGAYSDWDIRVLTRRLAKLKDFGPADEVCEVIGNMPTDTLENLLYRKAGQAGVSFTREHLMEMGRWNDVLHDITTHELSDENIDQFVENVRTAVEEAEQLVENEEKDRRRAKRAKRSYMGFAAVVGVLSGIYKSRKKKSRR